MIKENPYARITGKLSITAERLLNRSDENLIFMWEGGDIIGITEELLSAADSRFIQRDGDELTIGQFKLKIIDHYPSLAIYLAQRVNHG